VIFRAADGQVHELYWSKAAGKWADNNLTGTLKSPKAAGDPCGFALQDKNTQHIVYRAEDGDIIEFYRKAGSGAPDWAFRNLTKEAGAPKAESNPCGYALEKDDSEHVLFRCGDGQVHELYWSKAAGKWAHTNLSGMAKAPKAAGDPCAYPMEKDRTQHVIYRSTDGNVIELFRKATGDDRNWYSKDLTSEAGATKADSDPCGYVLNKDNSQHVVFRGTDGQIHELFWSKAGGKWGTANLSAMAGAPKANSEPAGYVLNKDNTQHVVFRSGDGDVIELYRKEEGDRSAWRMNNLTAATKAPKMAGDSASSARR
jgi:hypothetical protein